VVGSLLLGLYDDSGLLHHVGYTSSFNEAEKKELTKKLEPLIAPPGFTGNKPGGPSRWSTKKTSEWEPLKTKLVVEVQFDHFTGGRFVMARSSSAGAQRSSLALALSNSSNNAPTPLFAPSAMQCLYVVTGMTTGERS